VHWDAMCHVSTCGTGLSYLFCRLRGTNAGIALRHVRTCVTDSFGIQRIEYRRCTLPVMYHVTHVRTRILRSLHSVTENKRGNSHLARAHARDQYLQISPRGAIPHVRSLVLPPCDSGKDRCTARAPRHLWVLGQFHFDMGAPGL